jgi:hypothetical protein
LDAFDEEVRFIRHGTNVPWYVDSAQIPGLRKRGERVEHPSARGRRNTPYVRHEGSAPRKVD